LVNQYQKPSVATDVLQTLQKIVDREAERAGAAALPGD
jgi:hypothetical protein